MTQFKLFLKTNKKMIIGGICVLLVIFATFFIVYQNNVKLAAEKALTQNIFTEYDTTTQGILNGKSVTQDFKTHNDIYGVKLKFNTDGKKINANILYELFEENKKIASGNFAADTLQDGVETPFMFTSPVIGKEDGAYTLKVTVNYENQSEKNLLSLWKDGGKHTNLTENNAKADGAIFLNLAINVKDTFLGSYFATICGLLLLAVIVGFCLIYVFKVKLHTVFFVLVILFGIVYSLVFPPHMAPDEKAHILTAYKWANVILDINPDARLLPMRESDTEYTDDASNFNVYTYQKVQNELFHTADKENLVRTKNIAIQGSNLICYLPTITGIVVSRLLHLNYITMIMVSRMLNLLVFALLGAFAIKLIPFGKNILFAVGFLPMCLSLAASFSYDISVIGLALLFIALCIRFAYGDEKMTVKRTVLLSVLAFILAPTKLVYIFITALCVIIPKEKFKTAKKRFLSLGAILLSAILGFIIINISMITSALSLPVINLEDIFIVPNYAHIDESFVDREEEKLEEAAKENAIINGTENKPEIDYSQDEFYTPSYILSHKRDTAALVMNTIQENTAYYLRQMVGGQMVEPILIDIHISEIFVALLYLCLFLATLQTKEKMQFLKPKHKAISALIVLCVAGALFVASIGWTPVENATIWGFQGRYLLPILPLVMFISSGKNLHLEKDITPHLAFFMCALQFFVLLNGFVQIIN